jgi:hypothetical protein
MKIVMFHTHIHSLAIGAVNVDPNNTSPSTYSPESGWQTRYDGEAENQPGSSYVVIYGREPRNSNENGYQLFAWYVPNNYDHHTTRRYRKTIIGSFQLDDDGLALVDEVASGHKSWQSVANGDDFPMNVEGRLLKFSNQVRNNFESGEQMFIRSNTGSV